MKDHEHMQRRFYEHLKMHPTAHRAAHSFATKLAAKDPTAVATMKELAAKAKTDESAMNTLRAIAVVVKYEFDDSNIISGGVPAVLHAGKSVIKFALSPVAWAVSQGGTLLHWSGAQLKHISHII